MARSTIPNFTIENARILFRNFGGAQTAFNAKGQRTFALVLTTEQAADMERYGYNIKYLKPREEGEAPQPYITVKLNFEGGGRPPSVNMISTRGRTRLDGDTVGLLDWAEIKNVDIIVRPYEWDIQGKQGVTAYVQSLFVTIVEDALELKYAEPNDANAAAAGMQYDPNDAPFGD